MKTTTVTSFEDLQLHIRLLDPKGIWIFRGQKNAAWDLIPSLYRGLENLDPSYKMTDAEWISKMEHDVYRQFAQLVRRYRTPSNQWEEICLAQHYRVPTRLLDWTRHLMTATYFALDRTSDTAAAIWCFDIGKYPFPAFLGRITNEIAHRVDLLNSISLKRQPSFFQEISQQFVARSSQTAEPVVSSDVEDLDRGFLVILDPPHFDGRIAAQEGLFSVYCSFDDGDLVWNHSQYLEAVANKIGIDMLHKIVIPKDAHNDIRISLERIIGINWHELFPDLSGVGMYLHELRENVLQVHSEARTR